MTKSRLFIDLSTLARWHGPPVGIPRCQQKYAEYALRYRPEAIFTLFDPRNSRYRPVSRDSAEAIIEGRMKPDFSMMPDPSHFRRRTIDSIPLVLQPAYWWITKFRRKVLELLEQWRLDTTSDATRRRISAIQGRLIPQKLKSLFYDYSGRRIERRSLDAVGGPVLELTASDTTLAMQSDWAHTSVADIAEMHRKAGSRHVVLCHDIIPILFPEWYSEADVSQFTNYWQRAFAIADRVVFTSQCSKRDAETYCRSVGITIADTRVVPMGTDVAGLQGGSAVLPEGLSPDKYALFVSTIEPRKNHRMLVEVWKRLARRGLLAATGFKLVFVGRPGWKMGSFLEDLRQDPEVAGSIVHLANIPDATLAVLYQNCGFCLYPPLYEGFGLPPVEALALGKAVIASNAGPIAEIVGDFGVCLDPEDVDAWTARIAAWIEDPTERNAIAARAAEDYRPLTWDASAERFFEAVMENNTKPDA